MFNIISPPSQTFNFNNNKIHAIVVNGKTFISSASISEALEYSTSKSITNLFNANKVEFIEGEDYTVIDMVTVKNAPYKQLFFSIEGVILITMLAKTQKAIEFRAWAKKTLVEKKQTPQLPKMDSAYFLQISQLMAEKEILLERKTQEIQVLEHSKAIVEKNLEIKEVEVKEKNNTIKEQSIQIENATKLFKQIADKTGCVKFQACARHLGITDTVLRTLLIKNGWRRKDKHFPTTDGVNKSYVKLLPEEFDVKFKDGNTQKKSSLAFYITEKGYNQILEQITGILVN